MMLSPMADLFSKCFIERHNLFFSQTTVWPGYVTCHDYHATHWEIELP